MNEYIEKARQFLVSEGIDYLLVNSTNEFLVEYNDLQKNSRYFLTGFSGSTGDAVVSKDKVYLFVDGRYHTQADLEVNHDDITVVKLQMGDKVLDAMFKLLDSDKTFGICAKKNSQSRYESLKNKLEEKNITIKLFKSDPILTDCETQTQDLTEIPQKLTGKTTEEKLQELTKDLLEDEAILVTNLEDLSYVYNTRDFHKENSCSMEGKAILTKNDSVLFKDKTLNDFENYVKNLDNITRIYVDKSSISAYDYNLLGDRAKAFEINPIRFKKCVKSEAEIEHLKDAFRRTDLALRATRKFIEETDNISEFDIKTELEKNFKNYGALGQSFTSIVAKDENAALAHYSKSSKDEVLKEGSLILIDCGGYYDGGLATDITRVFVKGTPSVEQKKVYTTVLKSFLRAYNAEKFECGFDIDKIARDFLEENAPDGYTFSHGLGHGIGVSVHEGPPRLSTKCEDSVVPIVDNMCFTIEPGLYQEGHFGVRLENSCYLNEGKIKSFTNMCYEKKLIDYSMLDEQELEWLKEFEVL